MFKFWLNEYKKEDEQPKERKHHVRLHATGLQLLQHSARISGDTGYQVHGTVDHDVVENSDGLSGNTVNGSTQVDNPVDYIIVE